MSKTRSRILAFLLIGSCVPLWAQKTGSEQIPEWQLAFENLAPASKEEYREHLVEASRLFGQKRIFESLNALSKAEKIYQNNPNVLNLKGACYVEFRDFPNARKYFREALALSPDSSDILFNVAEIDFVTKQWASCEKNLTTVLKLVVESIEELKEQIASNPPNKTQLTAVLRGREKLQQLSEFKLFLAKLRLDKTEEAKTLAGKYDFNDDTPFYYFTQASLAYENKDNEKAEEWVRRAQRVFRKEELISPWKDTLIEFGYIRGFYGGDLEASGEPPTP